MISEVRRPRFEARRLVLAAGVWGLASILVVTACGTTVREVTPPVPMPAPEDIETSVYFIGDAGKPAKGGDPVLLALEDDLREHPGDALVVFLGDNLYPKGLPPIDAPDRAESERRLDAQIQAVLRGGGRGIFIPGNHDWQQGGADGWWRVHRQAVFIDQHRPTVQLLPRNGCPGPVERDVGDRFRLIILDTQWYLHGGPRPGLWSPCRVRRIEDLGDSLAAAVARAGDREVLVAAHHPIESTGKHGGHFTAKQHIFPLTEAASWAWLPLPIIGSLYPLSRQWGISNQDQSGGHYKKMVAMLDSAFTDPRPLLYAAGHEHNLEVLERETVRYLLVSGAGYYDHTSATGWRDNSRYAEEASGYMRVDALHSGKIRLQVVTVDETAARTEAFSTYLE